MSLVETLFVFAESVSSPSFLARPYPRSLSRRRNLWPMRERVSHANAPVTLLRSNVPPWRYQSRADTISILESARYRSRSGTASFSASLASSIVKGSATTHRQNSSLSNPVLQYGDQRVEEILFRLVEETKVGTPGHLSPTTSIPVFRVSRFHRVASLCNLQSLLGLRQCCSRSNTFVPSDGRNSSAAMFAQAMAYIGDAFIAVLHPYDLEPISSKSSNGILNSGIVLRK